LNRKTKHTLIRKFNPTQNEKEIIITQLLYNIKKNHINLFSLYSMKKINKRKKYLKREKNKIENILKYFF
jgi:hypothetical protein